MTLKPLLSFHLCSVNSLYCNMFVSRMCLIQRIAPSKIYNTNLLACARYVGLQAIFSLCLHFVSSSLKSPADLTVSKRPGTSSRIEIHFAVFNRLYLLFCFIKLVEIW